MMKTPAQSSPQGHCPRFNMVGLVVQMKPDLEAQIIEALNMLDGVDIHMAECGQAVVTVDEAETAQTAVDTITEINNISGVLSTSVAYHHFDPELVTQESSL